MRSLQAGMHLYPNFLVQFTFTYRNRNSAVNKTTSAKNLTHATTSKKINHYICNILLQREILRQSPRFLLHS